MAKCKVCHETQPTKLKLCDTCYGKMIGAAKPHINTLRHLVEMPLMNMTDEEKEDVRTTGDAAYASLCLLKKDFANSLLFDFEELYKRVRNRFGEVEREENDVHENEALEIDAEELKPKITPNDIDNHISKIYDDEDSISVEIQPPRIRGWFLAFMIYNWLGVISSLSQMIIGYENYEYTPTYGLQAIVLIITLLLAVSLILISKKNSAGRILYVVVRTSDILTFLLMSNSFTPEVAGTLIGVLIPSAAWSIYLFRSKRVKVYMNSISESELRLDSKEAS